MPAVSIAHLQVRQSNTPTRQGFTPVDADKGADFFAMMRAAVEEE